jgi:NhaA family Na+:H+ antiporter
MKSLTKLSKISKISALFKHASEKGGLLLAGGLIALCFANSPFLDKYFAFIKYELSFGFLTLSVQHWVNDMLMSVFFFLVGMEIKRELIEGNLSDNKQRILPFLAACGGVIVPAIIYGVLNYNTSETLRGWAIPAATDIAFAIAVLTAFGKGIPLSLKVLLTAIAIIDDLIAVIIIAVFYTNDLRISYLIVAGLTVCIICILPWFDVKLRKWGTIYYLLLGLILWYAIFLSGVHATIAGVIMGFLIPLNDAHDKRISPLKSLEAELHPYVSYFILPLFAFVNCGLNFSSVSVSSMLDTVTLGIILGLFLGKQLGIFGTIHFLSKTNVASLPKEASYPQIYAVSVLCGIGFTMSLFIGGLAFEQQENLFAETKLGVFLGSLLSAIYGAILLKTLKKKTK